MAEGRGRAWQPELLVDPDPFARAAALVVAGIADVLARESVVRLAIPGGSALRSAAVARRDLGDAWGCVALTWVDERCVPFDDVESNRGAASRMGLFGGSPGDRNLIEPASVLPLYLDGETSEEAVARVEAALSAEFANALDVVLLGMGADGHVASLFPSLSWPSHGMVAFVAESPKPPPRRITLTRRALATADRIVLVVAGEGKRDALERLIGGDARLPAHGLEGLVVVTDLDSNRRGGRRDDD